MLEDVGRGHVRTRPLPLSGSPEKLFVMSENLPRLNISTSIANFLTVAPIFKGVKSSIAPLVSASPVR